MTLLRQKIESAKAPPPAPAPASLLARARETFQRGEHVTLPVLGAAWIELASEVTVDEIESQVFEAMAALKLPPTGINVLTYDSRRTALTLAWAVRNPDNHAEHYGTSEDWLALDIDMILSCGLIYADVRERLNPVGISALTEEAMLEIRLAIEKKNPMYLRSFGVAMLSLYLLSTASQPAASPPSP
jgi:hypothetical protein